MIGTTSLGFRGGAWWSSPSRYRTRKIESPRLRSKPSGIVGVWGDLVDQLGGEVGIGRGRGDPELDLDGAGDFQVGLQGGRAKHQDVPALGERQPIAGGVGVVPRPLVVAAVGASTPGSTRYCRRSSARDASGRMCRSCGSKATCGGSFESVPSAFKIKRRRPGSGQGPFALGPPEAAVLEPAGRRAAVVAGAHDVEQHGRIVVDAVLVAAQPAVVPAQPERQQVDAGLVRELHFARDVRVLPAVDPGPDHQSLRRFLGLRRAPRSSS